MPGKRGSIHARNMRFVVLPTRSHTMSGAVAACTDRAAKSSSFVTMIALLFSA